MLDGLGLQLKEAKYVKQYEGTYWDWIVKTIEQKPKKPQLPSSWKHTSAVIISMATSSYQTFPAPDGFTMLGYLAPFLLSRLFGMASRSAAVALHLKSKSYACSVAVIKGDQRGVERL
jgi:hypothetical protein